MFTSARAQFALLFTVVVTGFYVGLTLIGMAALLRLGELRSSEQCDTPHTRYKVTSTPVPPVANARLLLPGLFVKAL